MKLPKISLTWKIMIGLVLGIFVGWLIHELDISSGDHHVFGIETQTLLAFIRSLSTLFLNLIKSIIAPLIFATLVVGIAGTGDIKQVGRSASKSLLYFEIVTTLALFIGLAAVNITRPGEGVSLAGVARKATTKATLAEKAQDLSKESTDAAKKADELRVQAAAIPTALAEAERADATRRPKSSGGRRRRCQRPDRSRSAGKAADIWRHHRPSVADLDHQGDGRGRCAADRIFSVIFALAVTAIGKKAQAVIEWCQSLADIMFRFTEYVMKFAPVGVGAAMAYTIGHNEQGLGVLMNLGQLVLTLYGGSDRVRRARSAADRADLQGAAQGLLQRRKNARVDRVRDDIERIRPAERRWKISPVSACRGVSSGSCCRPATALISTARRCILSLASIFVAQAAGVELSWTQQIVMVATLMLTSKGVAGVPRASLVILLGTLASFTCRSRASFSSSASTS